MGFAKLKFDTMPTDDEIKSWEHEFLHVGELVISKNNEENIIFTSFDGGGATFDFCVSAGNFFKYTNAKWISAFDTYSCDTNSFVYCSDGENVISVSALMNNTKKWGAKNWYRMMLAMGFEKPAIRFMIREKEQFDWKVIVDNRVPDSYFEDILNEKE